MQGEGHEQITRLKSELEPERQSTELAVRTLTPLKIQNQAQRDAFFKFLNEVKTKLKALEEREKMITRPAMAQLKLFREVVGALKSPYEALEKLLKEKLGEYETAVALETQAAFDTAAQLAAAGDTDGARVALTAVANDTLPPPGDDGVRHPWEFEILNKSILPIDFVLPNMKAIREEMRRQLKEHPGETPVLAGVRFTRALKIVGAKSK